MVNHTMTLVFLAVAILLQIRIYFNLPNAKPQKTRYLGYLSLAGGYIFFHPVKAFEFAQLAGYHWFVHIIFWPAFISCIVFAVLNEIKYQNLYGKKGS